MPRASQSVERTDEKRLVAWLVWAGGRGRLTTATTWNKTLSLCDDEFALISTHSPATIKTFYCTEKYKNNNKIFINFLNAVSERPQKKYQQTKLLLQH